MVEVIIYYGSWKNVSSNFDFRFHISMLIISPSSELLDCVLRTFWPWSMRAFVSIPRFNGKIWTLLRLLTAELFWMIPNLPKSVNVYFSFPVALLARYKWVGTMKAIHDPALEGSRKCQLHDHYWPSVTPSNIIEKDRLWSQSTIALQPSVTFLPRARSVHN